MGSSQPRITGDGNNGDDEEHRDQRDFDVLVHGDSYVPALTSVAFEAIWPDGSEQFG